MLNELDITQHQVSLVLRVDEDWREQWTKPTVLDDVPANVPVQVVYQERGTSYTEVVDAAPNDSKIGQ